jgi:hypothetical protein
VSTPDPLAEFYAATPRQSSNLTGRSGVHGQVDQALNELQIPAELDKDGDWKLVTDVGPFLLIVDQESSDLVLVQTIESMESKIKNSADEMHVLLALNFEAHGIARFGAIKDSGQNLLVLTARLAPDLISRDGIKAMLRDSMRLSRRVDELLGKAPPQPAAAAPSPAGDWQAADAALAQAEAQAANGEPPPQPAQPEPPPQPAESLPAADWYDDPYGQTRLRYWDGQSWTQHTAQ